MVYILYQSIFQVRSQKEKHIFPFGETQEIEHLYICQYWYEGKIKTENKLIYEDNSKNNMLMKELE